MFKKIINFTPLEKTGESKKTKTSLEKQKIASKSGFLDSLTGFVKYHNAFSIALIFIFLAFTSAMAASEDVRDAILGEEIVEKIGVDNSFLLNADLASFDLAMEIVDVTEDAEPLDGEEIGGRNNFYIDYQYQTLGISDNAWQPVLHQKRLVVSKTDLAGRDLGLYVIEELGEVIDSELVYLGQVQKNEKEIKGPTFVTEETKYEGLKKMVFNTKTKELPGYQPVVKPIVSDEIVTTPPNGSMQNAGLAGSGFDDFTGTIEELDGNGYPVDSTYYVWLMKNCLEIDSYWYDDICNSEKEVVVVDSSETGDETDEPDEEGEIAETGTNEAPPTSDIPTCDVDNLNLCTTQEMCTGINSFWYDEVCNLADKAVVEEPTDTDVPDPEAEENTTNTSAPEVLSPAAEETTEI